MKKVRNICEEVSDVMSSRDKFIQSIGDVEFVLKRYAKPGTTKNLAEFATYSAHNERQLEDFYDMYKLRGYDKLKIMRVVKLDGWKMGYYVELSKDYDSFSLCVEMLLETF